MSRYNELQILYTKERFEKVPETQPDDSVGLISLHMFGWCSGGSGVITFDRRYCF